MKKATIILASLIISGTSFANDNSANSISTSNHTPPITSDLIKLNLDTRVDWQIDNQDGHKNDSQTGFKGRYLVIRADGKIYDGLTYSWRQRLNKQHSDQSFFDATDWIYLNYAYSKWNFQVGKQVVAIGGWEYDRAPIDLYGCSVFWNNIPCYDLGVSVGYDFNNNNRLTAQVTQSPFFAPDNRNLYAYNLFWSGNHGIYSALWSVNLIEYTKGRFINYISLGNRFNLNRWRLDVDIMNRATSHQKFLFRDCTLIGELSFAPTDSWRIHAKVTYDVNKTGSTSDYTVLNGTELTMAGAGVEFYPLRKKLTSLRFHANAYYSWGKNANYNDLMQKNSIFASIGVTWDINLFALKGKF
ncbi:MAG: OprO/OprP family phosphate-selective porin [Muribaculum sp.]|nr:OprO/OprP family phosphate-selective porin [Muribaculaceae bacterium]MCM1080607.1 OprO/OprP family phosphate-selective porin [Muribaculum sp.]